MIKHRDSMLNSLLAKENREPSFFIVNKFVKKVAWNLVLQCLRNMNVYFPEQKLGAHFLDRVHMHLDVDFTNCKRKHKLKETKKDG